jgi:uncharacterized membrane protein YoaK (UPF0700 family)
MATKEKSIFHNMTHKQAIMCLTFIGGFVDSAGYVMLFELFTASITGNIVAATLPIWRIEPGFSARAIVVLSIGLGAGCVTMYSMKLRFATTMNKWEIGLRLFACELVALVLAMIVGLCLNYPAIDSNTVFVQSALMAFSMGVQNGAAMVLIPNCPPTTAMTGNTVRFYIYGAEALNFWLASHNYVELYPAKTGKPDGYDQKMQKNSRELALKFRIFLASLGPFTVGAVFGVPCAYAMGMACLVFPILIVMWVLYCISKGLEAERVEEIAKNGEKEAEVTQSPMYAAVDNVDAESGNLSGRTGLDHHSNVASGAAGQAEGASEQDSGAGLSHVRSYQLIYDDAYDGEEVTSEQLHKL